MAALLMNKNFHGNAFFKMVIFAPYVIAPIIIGIIWGYILNPNYGLLNSVLRKIGLDMFAIEWIGGTKSVPIVIGDGIHMAGTGISRNDLFIRNQSNTGRYLRSL